MLWGGDEKRKNKHTTVSPFTTQKYQKMGMSASVFTSSGKISTNFFFPVLPDHL